MTKLKPGDRVKLTGKFLRNTGQQAGFDGVNEWIVQACSCSMCSSGRFVATNEESYDDPSRPRHINAANLFKVGTLHADNAL